MSRLAPSVIVPDMADATARRTFEAEFRRLCAREVEIVADTRASTSPRGALLAQDPAPGTRLTCAQPRVSITLSSGPSTRIDRLPTEMRLPDLRVTPVEPAQDVPPPPPPLIVPDLSEPAARTRFARLVLTRCDRPLDLVEQSTANDAPVGAFLAQRPPPGVTLSCRTPQVIILISSGPVPAPPPEPRPQPEPRPEPRPAPQPQPVPQPVPQPEPPPPPPPEPEAAFPWPWIAGAALLAGGGFLLGRFARRAPRTHAPDAGIARGQGHVSAEVQGRLESAAPKLGIRWRMPPPIATLVPKGDSHG
jgi:hypothetical protein